MCSRHKSIITSIKFLRKNELVLHESFRYAWLLIKYLYNYPLYYTTIIKVILGGKQQFLTQHFVFNIF